MEMTATSDGQGHEEALHTKGRRELCYRFALLVPAVVVLGGKCWRIALCGSSCAQLEQEGEVTRVRRRVDPIWRYRDTQRCGLDRPKKPNRSDGPVVDKGPRDRGMQLW